MLRRVIASRNEELIALQIKRDELRQERDCRGATVSALIAQVDRSQYVKEERKREAAERAKARRSLGGRGR